MFSFLTRRKRRTGLSQLAKLIAVGLTIATLINITINWRNLPFQMISWYLETVPGNISTPPPIYFSRDRSYYQNLYSATERNNSGNQTVFTFPQNSSQQSEYFISTDSGLVCFKEGTTSITVAPLSCKCNSGWYGQWCSIPSIVYFATTPWKKQDLVLRKTPRRIIQAFPFNMEFEMLDIRLDELFDIIDVFLILESNFTAYGTQKDLHLLKKLENNEYSRFSHKIVHVFLDYFPEDAHKDGWIADGLHRNYIGTHGLKKISGWNMTDLFLLSDADEIPSRDALQFLKWHDGYTDPIGITFRSFVYGFFWSAGKGQGGQPKTQQLFACVTMGMLAYVLRYHAYFIRTAPRYIAQHQLELKVFLSGGGRYGPWTIGTNNIPAGWHCSWCLDPDRIRNKLISAQNGDFPRWGDYPEKSNVTYIKSLVGQGKWFDDKSTMAKIDPLTFVPKSVLENQGKYSHLLTNMYAQRHTTDQDSTVNTTVRLGTDTSRPTGGGGKTTDHPKTKNL